MKPGKAFPASFIAPGVRIPLNTPSYCTFLYLQPCREKEEGEKPLFAGKKGSQILSLLASVTSVFGAGFFSTKATQSGELKAILVAFPVPPSLL